MENHKKSPIEDAGFFSNLFFCWLLPILQEGNRDDLHFNDLYTLPAGYKADEVFKSLTNAWNQELEKQRLSGKKPSLLRAIVKAFGLEQFLLGILLFVEICVLKMLQPVLLGYLLHYYREERAIEGVEPYYYAGGLVLTLVLSPLVRRPLQYNTQLLGMKLRVAASSLLYNKALKLSLKSLKITSLGQMTSLVGTDVNHLDGAVTSFHHLWIAPCQLIIAISIINRYLGWSALSGVAVFLLVILVQGLMGILYQYYCSEQVKHQDERLGIMTDLIQKIRLVKMHTWELVFAEMVDEARTSELSWIRKKNFVTAVNKCLYYTSLKLTICLTLLIYFMTGGQITAEKVYVTIAVYNNIRYPLANCFPAAIQHAADGITVIKRLQNFLMLEERKIEAILPEGWQWKWRGRGTPRPKSDIAIELDNVSLKWHEHEPYFLNNISFDLKPGELLVLLGPVGSGKTTLLNLILNELNPNKGKVQTHGTIAYCSQQPMIFPGTVLHNVLFGKRFDRWRYNSGVSACALTHDIQQFPYGERTVVGESGIALSGGQQLRLALLRAVFADADIYLLDLPLSGVDSKVRRHLMDDCINGILEDKSRIVVTNEIQLLQAADKILVLNSGRMEAFGTYTQLVKQGFDFRSFIQNHTSSRCTLSEMNDYDRKSTNMTDNELHLPSNFVGPFDTKLKKNTNESTEKSPLIDKTKQTGSYQQSSEVIPIGDVQCSKLWSYISASESGCCLITVITLWLLTQALNNGGDYWIKFWTKLQLKLYDASLKNVTSGVNQVPISVLNSSEALLEDPRVQVNVFIGILGSLMVSSMVKNFLYFRMALAASRRVHDQMYAALTMTSMKFFSDNPSGQILTRFSRDLSVIDSTLPNCLYETVEISLNVIGYLIIIILICPVLMLPASGLLIALYFTRRYNMKPSLAIRRIESTLRSPILSQLTTTFRGLTTIRAFHREDQFRAEFQLQLDRHSTAWLAYVATTRWLGLVLDWTAVVFLTLVILVVMSSNLDGPEIGLIISSVLPLATMLQWVTRQSAELENQLVSVERIEQFIELEPENDVDDFGNYLDTCSSARKVNPGEITFSNVTLEYNPGTPVLKNISFNIKPNEKIGIIGRTGAGKSSILNALFRLTDISSGEITVDNVNIRRFELHALRSKIGIIPQDPLLLSRRSIRQNLDPYNVRTDNQIWNILGEVRLRKTVEVIYGSLNAPLSNCSIGEKQLLCFARAMLMNCKLLVLDEATSNLDPASDAIIQKILRQKRECTVITIAHKLNTVIDSDRVLVLEDGVIQEFDEPTKLLNNPDSKLSYYVRTGTGNP